MTDSVGAIKVLRATAVALSESIGMKMNTIAMPRVVWNRLEMGRGSVEDAIGFLDAAIDRMQHPSPEGNTLFQRDGN